MYPLFLGPKATEETCRIQDVDAPSPECGPQESHPPSEGRNPKAETQLPHPLNVINHVDLNAISPPRRRGPPSVGQCQLAPQACVSELSINPSHSHPSRHMQRKQKLFLRLLFPPSLKNLKKFAHQLQTSARCDFSLGFCRWPQCELTWLLRERSGEDAGHLSTVGESSALPVQLFNQLINQSARAEGGRPSPTALS